MNRMRKSCAYRDCNVNSQTNPELTLFQFPKNRERVARWCELGLVDPASLQSRPPGYMCELHFSRIYMCFSSRRKMLLNTAVPRAYGEEYQEEEVESSTVGEGDETTMEEHLDESMADDNDDVATEIIYMDPEDDPISTDQLVEPQSSKKRPAPDESFLQTKIIKVEQMPSISRSMIVSSSSTALPKLSTRVEGSQTPITPPKGTILRKVKLKKRPTTLKTIIIKTSKPSTVVQSTTAEGTAASTAEPIVSSSPEKISASIDSDAIDEEQPEKVCSPKKAAEAVASSSNTVTEAKKPEPVKEEKKPPPSSSPVKKDEAIYEFIFKGEEYVQLPKAKYYGEQKKLQDRLDECEREKMQMQKKIEKYLRAMKSMKDVLACVDDNSENDE